MTKNEKIYINKALRDAFVTKAIATVYVRNAHLVPEANRDEAKATFLMDYHQAEGRISALSMFLSPAEYQEEKVNYYDYAYRCNLDLEEGRYVREYRYWFEDEEEIPF